MINYNYSYLNLIRAASDLREKADRGKNKVLDNYPVAIYLMGLAGECALRHIIQQHNPNNPSIARNLTHNFTLLFEAASLTPKRALLYGISKDIKAIECLWDNKHRYHSAEFLCESYNNSAAAHALNLNSHDIRNNKSKTLKAAFDRTNLSVRAIGKIAYV